MTHLPPAPASAIAQRAAQLMRPAPQSGGWPVERSMADPESETLAQTLERLRTQALEADRKTACGLTQAGIARCTPDIESECPWRGAANCPKVRQRHERDRLRELRDAARRRGIPERVLCCTWDRAPAPTRCMAAVRKWLATSKSMLLLSGTNGCGKTTAAGWAASPHPALGGDRRRTRYITAAEATGPDHDAIVRSVSHLELLIIDDLGQAYFGGSGFTLNRLEVLVDSAYQRMVRVLLCTDIAVRRDTSWPFFDLVGPRITSRIAQAGTWETNLGGPFEGE